MNIEEICVVCAYPKDRHRLTHWGALLCPFPVSIGMKAFSPYPRSRATETETLRFALALGRIAAGTCGALVLGYLDAALESFTRDFADRFLWSNRRYEPIARWGGGKP